MLGRFEDDERIVTLYDVVEVGGRSALLLKFAGRTTPGVELHIQTAPKVIAIQQIMDGATLDLIPATHRR